MSVSESWLAELAEIIVCAKIHQMVATELRYNANIRKDNITL